MPPQPPANRINPALVPSPVAVNEADQSRFNETAFVTSTLGTQSPPLPSTMARYVDDGNSSSRFMRLTTYCIPCNEDLLHASRMPLALVMQPFAQRPSYEDAVPLVDFGPDGPIRCNRCRAYMNPFMTFGKGGRVFLCNICYMQNDVRDGYFCNLDMMGRRADASSRPELMYGTIDVVAPPDYLLKRPSKASIIFAMETSRAAVQSGTFMAYVQAVKEFLSSPQTAQRYAKVGIVTFDKNVQFYDLRASLIEPQLLIMSDVMDPFVPLHDGLFFDPIESKDLALTLLERLPKLFGDTRTLDACLGSAALSCYEALKGLGGRLVLMTTTLPSSGVGALKAKEIVSTASLPADKVNPALLPQADFYKDLGNKCANAAISVSIVATPSSSVDMPTINELCRITSGTALVYPKFAFDMHMKRLVEDVKRTFLRPAHYDCVAKVRCGAGLQNDLNLGQFTLTEAGNLRFACLDSEQTFATTFVYDSKLAENDKIGFQLAVLHTTADGQARIRILNLSLTCSTDIGNIYKGADLDAIVSVQAKQAAAHLQDHPLPFIAAQVASKCAHILAAYRKHCAANMSTGQLVLPDALKLLPLYTSCILKQPAFLSNLTNFDAKVASANSLVACAMDCLPALLYPRMFALHHILDSDASRYYPPCIRLSKEFLEPHGVYLLENSQRLVIWIGPAAESSTLEQIFGAGQVNGINTNIAVLPDLGNEASSRIRTLIQKLQHQRSNYLGLSIVRSGIDPSEVEWAGLLAEEPQSSTHSYVDFLCRIHGQIQQELTTGPSLTERAAMLNFLH